MFHPVVEAWFRTRIGAPSPVQAAAWPAIAAGRDTLITAPTGSGKTLAAFLGCLDRLIRRGLEGGLEDRTEVLYISPLKALSNDIHRNLEQPIDEIGAALEAEGLGRPGLRIAVRTGDSPAKDRRLAAARPPHVLVTTPESAFILLTSESGRRALAGVRTVIVDEIHAFAGDKRGAHLCLSLERLDELVTRAGGALPQRIGLSATLRPLDVAARLLAGGRALPEIIDAGMARDVDLAVEVPRDELGAVCTHEQWGEIYDRLAALAGEARSTLVFVNTRSLAERVAIHLADRLGEDVVAAHHGSLSRARRHATEQRLKAGQLRVVVATASLELGIDVGAVDLVCLVGSPRSISVALQRVGRSGHALGRTSRGRFFPLTRDQLLECAAIVRAARRGEMDRIALREAPLDVLAQQIIAACACEEWGEDELFALVRRAAPYAGLARGDFDAVVEMVSQGAAPRRGRASGPGGALVHRDVVNRKLRGRRGARLAALTSGGAIPDNATYDVLLLPEATKIGTLDEDFSIDSSAGDVFLLGTSSWRVRRVEPGKVWVEDAHGQAPTVPFWLGEGPARTAELSAEVGALRRDIAARLAAEGPGGGPGEGPGEGPGRGPGTGPGTGPGRGPGTGPDRRYPETVGWLMQACALDARGALLACEYVAAGRAALGDVPCQEAVVVEQFFDESGGTQLVVHAPFGGRVNRALGLALRKKFCRSFDFELQAAATDDGVILSLSPEQGMPAEELLDLVRPEGLDELLTQAALQAPMFRVRWRWDAGRSLMLLRFRSGKKVPPALLRMRADDLLLAVFPEQQGCQDNHGIGAYIEPPDHPLVREALRDCLVELMDVPGLRALLEGIRSGAIRVVARVTPEPSVFSHEILNSNPYTFLDDAPLEERRARAVSVRRGLPVEVQERLGGLDAEVIAEVVEEAQPEVRDADELHELLLDRVVVPAESGARAGWSRHFSALVATGRAAEVKLPGGRGAPGAGEGLGWVATERRPHAEILWPGAAFAPDVAVPAAVRAAAPGEREPAVVDLVRGWMAVLGPVTEEALAARLGIEATDARVALAQLEVRGAVMRGRFSAGSSGIEMCDRRLLARIHRRTVDGLRKAIEPATPSEFLKFLLGWQGVRPGSQRRGSGGLARVIEQLQGFELAAGAWEREVLPARVAGYEPGLLDALCLAGEVAWGRVVPRAPSSTPTRAAPITLALRRDLGWLLGPREDGGAVGAVGEVPAPLSEAARAVLSVLERAGASFLPDLVAGAGCAASEVEEAIWELVAAGAITADGFAALRALLEPSPRGAGAAGRLGARPRGGGPVAAGRWSRLMPAASEGPEGLEMLARQYLCRYGVVFRDLLAREPAVPPWRDLVRVYRRLEMTGEIRGGRLVAGFVGEQFALPEAIDALRAARREPPSGEIVQLGACDPLNLVGIITPGPRIPAVAGHVVIYRDGVPLAPLQGAEAWARGSAATFA